MVDLTKSSKDPCELTTNISHILRKRNPRLSHRPTFHVYRVVDPGLDQWSQSYTYTEMSCWCLVSHTPCGPMSIHSPPFRYSCACAFTWIFEIHWGSLRILPSPPKIHLETPLRPSTLRLCCVSKGVVRPQALFLLCISSTNKVHTPHQCTFYIVWHHLCPCSH